MSQVSPVNKKFAHSSVQGRIDKGDRGFGSPRTIFAAAASAWPRHRIRSRSYILPSTSRHVGRTVLLYTRVWSHTDDEFRPLPPPPPARRNRRRRIASHSRPSRPSHLYRGPFLNFTTLNAPPRPRWFFVYVPAISMAAITKYVLMVQRK